MSDAQCTKNQINPWVPVRRGKFVTFTRKWYARGRLKSSRTIRGLLDESDEARAKNARLVRGFGKRYRIFRSTGFNEFATESTLVPRTHKKSRAKPENVRRFHYDPARTRLTRCHPVVQQSVRKLELSSPKTRTYLTHDNGGRPFLVAVVGGRKNGAGATVHIHKRADRESPYFVSDEDRYSNDDREWTYTDNMRTYKDVERVWPGPSPLTETTSFSGGSGDRFFGNTVLVQTSRKRYTFVGGAAGVYEFSTGSDSIAEFYSPVGNNDVPYAVAIGRTHVYMMMDAVRVPIAEIETHIKLTQEVKEDAYSYFYGHLGPSAWSAFGEPMKSVKKISERV